jgi:uncharacterized membrane protein
MAIMTLIGAVFCALNFLNTIELSICAGAFFTKKEKFALTIHLLWAMLNMALTVYFFMK